MLKNRWKPSDEVDFIWGFLIYSRDMRDFSQLLINLEQLQRNLDGHRILREILKSDTESLEIWKNPKGFQNLAKN